METVPKQTVEGWNGKVKHRGLIQLGMEVQSVGDLPNRKKFEASIE